MACDTTAFSLGPVACRSAKATAAVAAAAPPLPVLLRGSAGSHVEAHRLKSDRFSPSQVAALRGFLACGLVGFVAGFSRSGRSGRGRFRVDTRGRPVCLKAEMSDADLEDDEYYDEDEEEEWGEESDEEDFEDDEVVDEDEEEGGGMSILSSLSEEEENELAEAKKVEQEMAADEEAYEAEKGLDDDEDEEQDRQFAQRQAKVNIGPAPMYQYLIARHNAQRSWKPDGPDGYRTNSFQVKVATITEKIRNMLMHCRDLKYDYDARTILHQLVAKRRKLLDQLAWSDIDQYLKIRKELKIRHRYRQINLIHRHPEYKFPGIWHPQKPGRDRMRKLRKVYARQQKRLQRALKDGNKSPREILYLRQDLFRHYKEVTSRDEMMTLLAGKTPRLTYTNLEGPVP